MSVGKSGTIEDNHSSFLAREAEKRLDLGASQPLLPLFKSDELAATFTREQLHFMGRQQKPPYDGELFAAALRGSAEAIEHLIIYLVPDIYQMAKVECRRRNLLPDLAFDVAQESLLRAITTIKAQTIQEINKGFFYVITKNVALDLAKKKHAVSNQADYIDRIASGAASSEDVAIINEAFSKLSKSDRLIIDLMLVQEFSAREAADDLGISVAAVYKRYERALEKLKMYVDT